MNELHTNIDENISVNNFKRPFLSTKKRKLNLFITNKIDTLKLEKIQKGQFFVILKGPLGIIKFVRKLQNFFAYSNGNTTINKEIINNNSVRFISLTRNELQSFYGEIISRYDWLTAGFFHEFIIRGIGYRYRFHRFKKQNSLYFKIGYGHKVLFLLYYEPLISFRSNKRYDFVLSSMNKAKLKSFAQQIRLIKPTDPYKGKGIKYYQDLLKLKVGKVR
jgi:large subunit ribosomal protein L6